MKYLSSLSLFLAAFCCLSAQPQNGYPTGRKYFPWESVPLSVCLKRTYIIPGGAPYVVTPAGVPIYVQTIIQPSSGLHSHPNETSFTRPTMSPSFATTVSGSDGCSPQLYFKGPVYSGWTTFVSSGSGFPTRGINNYLGFYDWDVRGNPQLMRQPTSTYFKPYSLHVDTRHTDQYGVSGYSRYLTREMAQRANYLGFFYMEVSSFLNPNLVQFDLVRASLQDGGRYDCEMPAFSGTCLANPWTVRVAEQHLMGLEFDVVNPLIDHSTNLFTWLNVNARIEGCEFGPLDQYGHPVQADGLGGYWANQQVIHIVCNHTGLVQ